MSYEVKIDAFEGPIDLLLHLVEKNEVEIHDIQIAEITKQYLSYITKMKDMKLDVASEFLVMATKLMEMKVQTLLPQEKDEAQTGDEVDPRQKLVNRLLEYKKYKNLAVKLQEFEQRQKKSYTRNVAPLLGKLDFPDHNPLEEVDVNQFVEAFNKALEDYQSQEEEEVEEESTSRLTHLRLEDITVREQQEYIIDRLEKNEEISFSTLFLELGSRIKIIVTFMALLELIKQEQIKVEQKGNFGEIKIYYVGSGG